MTVRIFAFISLQLGLAWGLSIESGASQLLTRISVEPKCQKWAPVAMNENQWKKEYDGFGQITMNSKIQLKPSRSIASDQTHAALILLREPLSAKDFGLRLIYKNERALRTSGANPWEVLWLLFNYQGSPSNKQTNYMIFKPNGIELGRAWGTDQQAFLATQENPQNRMGESYELSLFRSGNRVSAFINGKQALDFTADQSHPLFDQAGHIGLYTEDAEVSVDKVEICQSL